MSLAYSELSPSQVDATYPVLSSYDREPKTGAKFVHMSGVTHAAGARVEYTVTTAPACPPLGEAPVRIIAPGFFGLEPAYMPLAEALSHDGHTTVTFKSPRHQGHQTWGYESLRHPERLLPQAIGAVATQLYDIYGVDTFHLLGHSMGGPAAVAAAEYAIMHATAPKILSVTMIDSAGATGHHMTSLAAKTPQVGREMYEACKGHPELRIELVKYGFTNVCRTLGEAISTSECRLKAPRLAALGKAGVTTVALFHDKDPFFPAEKAYHTIGDVVGAFIFGAPAGAGHLAPQIYPLEVAHEHCDALRILGVD